MDDVSQLLGYYRQELDGYFPKGGPHHIEDRDACGNTPLIFSVYRGLVHETEILLSAGAEIDARGEYDRTALHAAVKSGVESIISVLMRYKPDPTIRDSFGRTPMDIANSFLEEDVRERVRRALQGD